MTTHYWLVKVNLFKHTMLSTHRFHNQSPPYLHLLIYSQESIWCHDHVLREPRMHSFASDTVNHQHRDLSKDSGKNLFYLFIIYFAAGSWSISQAQANSTRAQK